MSLGFFATTKVFYKHTVASSQRKSHIIAFVRDQGSNPLRDTNVSLGKTLNP